MDACPGDGRLQRAGRFARSVVHPPGRIALALKTSREGRRALKGRRYSTVTDFARLRGWSTSVPMNTAVW